MDSFAQRLALDRFFHKSPTASTPDLDDIAIKYGIDHVTREDGTGGFFMYPNDMYSNDTTVRPLLKCSTRPSNMAMSTSSLLKTQTRILYRASRCSPSNSRPRS